MGSKTAIQWTDETANVIKVKGPDGKPNGWFCYRVSPGCQNCYAGAINQAGRFGGNGMEYKVPASGKWPEMMLLTDILDGWARRKKPKRIFLNSMTDTCGEFVPEEWIFKILDAARNAPSQTIQILTKRARRAYQVTKAWLKARGLDALPANVWIGVSVESQEWADKRIPWLLKIPATVRFLSCEPLLNKVDISYYLPQRYQLGYGETLIDEGITTGINWVIIGGESGPNARPFRVGWAYDLVEQCQRTGVAAFVKQLGAKPWQTGLDTVRRDEWPAGVYFQGETGIPGYPVKLKDKKGGNWEEWPADLRVRQFPGELVGAA